MATVVDVLLGRALPSLSGAGVALEESWTCPRLPTMYGSVGITLEGDLEWYVGLGRAATEHQGGSPSAFRVDGER